MDKKKEQNRVKGYFFRCKSSELDLLKSKAENAGYNKVSDFIRSRTLKDGEIVIDASNFIQSLNFWGREATKIGVNINQVTKAINTDVKTKGLIIDVNARAIINVIKDYNKVVEALNNDIIKLLKHTASKRKR